MQKFILLFALLALSGCASIVDSKYQPISITAMHKDDLVDNASCSLTNDNGTWYVKTPGSVTIQKSYADLTVTCRKNGLPAGMVSVKSASNGGVWGNILAGGIIGYAVDRSSGAGFDYPPTINVVLGKTLLLGYSKPDDTKRADDDEVAKRMGGK